MAELKTKPSEEDVNAFIQTVQDPVKKSDSKVILEIMESITHENPVMWGSSIIGFGTYHYRYASGREGDWFLTGFSPRKQSLTIYIMGGFKPIEHRLKSLGKHKTSKGCLYIKKLSDVNIDVLKELIQLSVQNLKEKHNS